MSLTLFLNFLSELIGQYFITTSSFIYHSLSPDALFIRPNIEENVFRQLSTFLRSSRLYSAAPSLVSELKLTQKAEIHMHENDVNMQQEGQKGSM